MQIIGAFEAKNRFAELLRRAEAGEVFCVTRHGKIVAQIAAPQPVATNQTQKAFKELRALRNRLQLTPEEVAAFRGEGRP